MVAALINALLGALWRRWLGGWRPFGWDAPGGRALKHLAMAALCWPLWVALPWWGAALGTGTLFAWFNIRHDNGGPGLRPLWRYGPAGLGYVIARPIAQRLPWTGRHRALLEPYCWTCWGEAWLGAVTFGAVAALA